MKVTTSLLTYEVCFKANMYIGRFFLDGAKCIADSVQVENRLTFAKVVAL